MRQLKRSTTAAAARDSIDHREGIPRDESSQGNYKSAKKKRQDNHKGKLTHQTW
jgi:hypothetical protein